MFKFISTFMALVTSFQTMAIGRGSIDYSTRLAKEKYSYVSLGDSMTTGFGFDDYYVDDDPDAEINGKDYKKENGCKNVRGFLNLSSKCYPALVGKYLTETYKNKDVEVIQLATNASRIDDIYYQISGTQTTDEFYKFILDANGEHESWNEIFGERARDKGYTTELDNNKAVNEVYKNAIMKADLVTLNAGFNNFGCFITGKMTQIIESDSFPFGSGFGGADTLQSFVQRTGLKVDVETIYKQIVNIVNQVANLDISQYEDITLDFGVIHVKRLVELLTLALVSYVYYINETTKLILNLNPSVELVVVGMCNPIRGTKIKVNDLEINAEEVLGKVFEICNLYSAVATEKANSYKYADVDNLNVALHIDDMKANDMDSSQIKRAYSGVYDLVNEFELSAMLPTFSNVKSQIENAINEQLGQPNAFKFVNYLTKSDAQAYLEKWTISASDLASFGIYADTIAGNVNNALNEYYAGIDYFVATFIRAANVETIDLSGFLQLGTINQEVLDSGSLDGLLNIYIRILLSNGMWNHPNEEGHITLANAIIETLKKEITARELGMQKAKILVADLIEEAKPFLEEFGSTVLGKIEEYFSPIADILKIKEIVDSVMPVLTEKFKQLKVIVEPLVYLIKMFSPVVKLVTSATIIKNLISSISKNIENLLLVNYDTFITVVSSKGFFSMFSDLVVVMKSSAQEVVYLIRTLRDIFRLSNIISQSLVIS